LIVGPSALIIRYILCFFASNHLPLTFTCNFNPDIMISSPCPHHKCWANIPPDEHPTACLFEKLGKKELGVTDLAVHYQQSLVSLGREVKIAAAELQLGCKNGWMTARVDRVCRKCGKPGNLCCNRKKCAAPSRFHWHVRQVPLFSRLFAVDNSRLYALLGQPRVQDLLRDHLSKKKWVYCRVYLPREKTTTFAHFKRQRTIVKRKISVKLRTIVKPKISSKHSICRVK
jgi:hypothetical protein